MKSESTPIADDEFFLRRVHKSKFRLPKIPMISASAFEPRLPSSTTRFPDTDGISLYREQCLAEPSACLATVPEEKRGDYGIVRISYAELTRLGLSVVSAPDKDIPGHVVIPEMNSATFQENQTFVREKMSKLATFASDERHIALNPQSTVDGSLSSVAPVPRQ